MFDIGKALPNGQPHRIWFKTIVNKPLSIVRKYRPRTKALVTVTTGLNCNCCCVVVGYRFQHVRILREVE